MFYVQPETPLKMSPPLKIEILSSPLFENFVGGSPPPPSRHAPGEGGGGTHHAPELSIHF